MLKLIKKIWNRIIRKKTAPAIDPFTSLQERGLVIAESTKPRMHSPAGIDGLYPWLIEIGEDCIISTDVVILAHDASSALSNGYTRIGRVSIGNRVFIGYRSIILCGITIGDNVIVGANSVVTKDVPSNCVVAGNPAKFICTMCEYQNKRQDDINAGPIFDHEWNYWAEEATMQEKEAMKNEMAFLRTGYIKSSMIIDDL